MPRTKLLLTLALATLSATAFGQYANPARPGTVNYVEGQANIDGHMVHPRSNGKLGLRPGQVLSTANGKAEILLTPGVFLRIGDNSAVQLVSPDLTHTEVRLEEGDANLEVDLLYPENLLLVDLPQGQTQILKHGLYTFNVASSTTSVFEGEANVYPGTDLRTDVRPIEVKGGHRISLNGEFGKPVRFDKDRAKESDLYRWSSLRSKYLGEANYNLAEEYAGYPGFVPGWFWAGYPYGYTWLPGDGLFYNPFGFGFYSPFYYGFGYGYRGGYYRGGYGGFHGGVRGGYAGGGGFHGGGAGGGGGHR